MNRFWESESHEAITIPGAYPASLSADGLASEADIVTFSHSSDAFSATSYITARSNFSITSGQDWIACSVKLQIVPPLKKELKFEGLLNSTYTKIPEFLLIETLLGDLDCRWSRWKHFWAPDMSREAWDAVSVKTSLQQIIISELMQRESDFVIDMCSLMSAVVESINQKVNVNELNFSNPTLLAIDCLNVIIFGKIQKLLEYTISRFLKPLQDLQVREPIIESLGEILSAWTDEYIELNMPLATLCANCQDLVRSEAIMALKDVQKGTSIKSDIIQVIPKYFYEMERLLSEIYFWV